MSEVKTILKSGEVVVDCTVPINLPSSVRRIFPADKIDVGSTSVLTVVELTVAIMFIQYQRYW